MSKSKRNKKKKISTPKVVIPTEEKTSRLSSEVITTWIPVLFPVCLSVLFVFFLLELSKNPDFKITLVEAKKWFQPFQYGLFSLLTVCFGYFGWRYLKNARVMNQIDRVAFLTTSLLVFVIYVSAFTDEISLNGDNAEYMIIAKSLVERGKVLRLEVPSETPNSLASTGLPLLLTPIYKLWGFDIIKMKALITFMGFSVFFLLYRLFVKRQGFALATMLALVGVTSPYVVGNSRDVMTETPFLLWSIISLILIIKYHESKTLNWKYYFLVFGAIIMTYITRAVGVSIFAALIIFLISNVSWSKIYNRDSRKQLFASIEFQKLFYMMLPLVMGAVLWQIWQQSHGVSQAALFLNSNLPHQVELNTQSALGVIPQMLFRPETYRFQNFYSSATLEASNLKNTFILVLILVGIITGFKQRNLLAGFTVITTMVLLLASVTPQQMVIIRYFSVLVPFLVYFLFVGTIQLLRYLFRKLRIGEASAILIKLIPALVLAQMLMVNMHGHSVNLTLSSVGNGPGYEDFVDVAKWSEKNLPDDAFVVSLKPRLFYVLSNKRGVRLSTIEEDYSKKFEVEKLALFKRLGITHVVLDGVSGATRENIFPIVKNNPDMFQTLYIGATSGTSSINKVIYPNQ